MCLIRGPPDINVTWHPETGVSPCDIQYPQDQVGIITAFHGAVYKKSMAEGIVSEGVPSQCLLANITSSDDRTPSRGK